MAVVAALTGQARPRSMFAALLSAAWRGAAGEAMSRCGLAAHRNRMACIDGHLSFLKLCAPCNVFGVTGVNRGYGALSAKSHAKSLAW